MTDDDLSEDFLRWLGDRHDGFWTEHGYYRQRYVQEQTFSRQQLEDVIKRLLQSGQIKPSIGLSLRPGELPQRVKLPDDQW